MVNASENVRVSPEYTVTGVPASTSFGVVATAASDGLFVPPVLVMLTASPAIAPSQRLSTRTCALLRVLTNVQVRSLPPTIASPLIVNVPPVDEVLTGDPAAVTHVADVSV